MFEVKATQKSESQIQGDIIQDLTQCQDIYLVKVHSATKSGVPDILLCVMGRFVAFEVKTQKGKPTELQLINIKKIRASGGLAFVIRSKEEAMHILTQIRNGEL